MNTITTTMGARSGEGHPGKSMSELTMQQLLQGLQQAVAEADQAVRRAQEPDSDCVGIQPQMAIDDVSFTVSFVADLVAPPAPAAPRAAEDVYIAVDQQALADATHVNTVSVTVRNRPVERIEVDGRHHIVPAGAQGDVR
ncbi:hypothetical protein [Streptomyces sp. NPDC057340]|uniref:hypothetical protein n=1 Tax=Streptomyces sp. NPDC057340 TaxID=3346103 RepID=UPI00364522FF